MTSIFPWRRVRSKLNIDVRASLGSTQFSVDLKCVSGMTNVCLHCRGRQDEERTTYQVTTPPLRPLAGWVGGPVLWDQGVWDGCSPSHCSFLNSHQRAQAAWHVYEGPTEEKGCHSWEGRMHENSEQSPWKGKEVETKCCRGSVAMQSPPQHLFAAPGSLRAPLPCHHPS